MKCIKYESEVLVALTVRAMLSRNKRCERQTALDTHRQEGVDNVSFDRTQRFVSDHHKDLLFFFQSDEVPKPRLLSQPGNQTENYVVSGLNTSFKKSGISTTKSYGKD